MKMGAQSVRNLGDVLLSTVDHSTSSNLRPISAKSDQFRVKKFKIIFEVGGLAAFRRSVFRVLPSCFSRGPTATSSQSQTS